MKDPITELQALAAGHVRRPRGNAVLAEEHASAATMAVACKKLVDHTFRDAWSPYVDDEGEDDDLRVAAPPEALPPLP